MSKLVKKQLAEIRRESARIEIERMRAHLAKKKQRLAELVANEKHWTAARKLERKARLQDLRRAIQRTKRVSVEAKRDKLRAIATRRREFEQWWASVQAERAARLREIRELRADLAAWTRDLSKRQKESVAKLASEAERAFIAFDTETQREADAMHAAIDQARRDLRADEYDFRTWQSNRRRESKSSFKPKKAKARAKEVKQEYIDNVENNLQSAEEWAWWRKERPSLLREARELGMTEGDQLAEVIRERVEADPDRALEYLQDDADAWVELEVRRAGFAA